MADLNPAELILKLHAGACQVVHATERGVAYSYNTPPKMLYPKVTYLVLYTDGRRLHTTDREIAIESISTEE
jgi:hypothetical protein